MSDLLQTALGFPTVLLTTLVGISLLYWLMVILGALDLDLIGGGDHGGDLHFGDAHAGDLGHHLVGGDVHAGDLGDAHTGVGDAPGGAGLLSAIGFTKVPLTISFSVWWLQAWLICLVGNRVLTAATADTLPAWILASIVLVIALMVTIPSTSVIVKPLAPIFVIHEAKSKRDYIGSTCEVKTGKVDADFGHADLYDGGDHLIVEVRCDKGDRFERGEKALIIDFDAKRNAYLIEPLDELLGSGSDSEAGPGNA